jgi:hypothetical protein
MANQKINLQDQDLISRALEHLTKGYEILEGTELMGGRTSWDALRDFAETDSESSEDDELYFLGI